MKCDLCGGTVIDREVSYTIEFKERMHIIEHVPAKECLQCGERLYSPETVEKIQKAIWQNQKPDRYIETLAKKHALMEKQTDSIVEFDKSYFEEITAIWLFIIR